jgi:hypothetical protein
VADPSRATDGPPWLREQTALASGCIPVPFSASRSFALMGGQHGGGSQSRHTVRHMGQADGLLTSDLPIGFP